MKRIIIAQTLLGSVGTVETLFGRGGIGAVPARTSEDILRLHRQQKADLIIADLSLPVAGPNLTLLGQYRWGEVRKRLMVAWEFRG